MKESRLRSGLDCDRGFQKDEAMRPPAVLAGLAALIGLAAPVHADPDPDASFLDALNNAGITYHYGSAAFAIGRRVCQLMDQGHPNYPWQFPWPALPGAL
jgi:hypothetical protein